MVDLNRNNLRTLDPEVVEQANLSYEGYIESKRKVILEVEDKMK